MFFDVQLLKHGGRFGIVWLVATRGVRFVMKKQIKELNIIKLCEDLQTFIISSSASPKKRFSLRLSVILINGIIKIFKEKAIMLQGELFSILCTVQRPAEIGSVTEVDPTVFETPPTPVVKVKTKRVRKPLDTQTPDTNLPGTNGDLLSQLPDPGDILQLQARADEISIREILPRRPEIQEDDLGFGVLSKKEVEEMQALLSKSAEAFRVEPQHASIEVESALRLAPVATTIQSPKKVIGEEGEMLIAPLEVGQSQIEGRESDLREKRAQEALRSTQDEGDVVAPVPSRILAESQDNIIERLVVEPKETRKSKETSSEDQLQRIKHQKKQVVSETAKLFVTKFRKRFIQINRCNEQDNEFVKTSCPLPISKINIPNDGLYNLLWFDDDVDRTITQVRDGSSTRGPSAGGSFGLRKTDNRSGQRSTLETESVSQIASKISLQPVEISAHELTPGRLPVPVPEITPVRLPVEMPVEDITPGGVPIDMPAQEILPEQLPIDTPVREKTTDKSKRKAKDPLTQITIEEPSVPQHPRKRKRILSPESQDKTNYKLRQQKITDMVIQLESDRILSLEDVCEKPINKLNIARAFADLLVLAANGFVTLKSEEDSIQLTGIEKGPKILRE